MFPLLAVNWVSAATAGVLLICSYEPCAPSPPAAAAAPRGTAPVSPPRAAHTLSIAAHPVFAPRRTVGSIYAVIFFGHPEDPVRSVVPKITCAVGVLLTAATPMLLPLDVANRNGGYLPMPILWVCFLCMIAFLSIIVIPWVYSFYSYNDTDTLKDRCCNALIFCFFLWAAFFSTFGTMYSYFGYADVPVSSFNSTLVDAHVDPLFLPATCEPGCREPVDETLEVPVSFVVYLGVVMVAFGWIFIVFFGGVGLVKLPIDLIMGYLNRTKKMELDQFARARLEVRERAGNLIDFGKTFVANASQGSKSRLMFQNFKQASSQLEADWREIKKAYKEGGQPIRDAVWLGLGCVGAALSVTWVMHITVYIVYRRFTGEEAFPMLNYVFVVSYRIFPLFSGVLYVMYAFWMVWSVSHGTKVLGTRFPCFPFHPMRLGGTYMASMLFNVMWILMVTVSVSSLCAVSFDLYARLTSADMIFVVQIRNARNFEVYWMATEYALFGVIVLAGVFAILFPKERKTEEQLEKDLQEILSGGGGKHSGSKWCTIM